MRALLLGSLTLALVGVLACRGDDGNNGPTPDGKTNIDGITGGDGGGPAVETTIFKITDGTIKEGTKVILNDVILTAVDGYGSYTGDMYIQDKAGGSGSGLKLYKMQRVDGGAISDLKPGDRLKVEGRVTYHKPTAGINDSKHPNKKHVKEISYGQITRLSGGTEPAPKVVTAKELTEDPTADGLESVLVQVKDVSALESADPTYGDFMASSATGNLFVDDDLYPHSPQPWDCMSVTGISIYLPVSGLYSYRLHPRSASDVATSTGCKPIKTVTIKDIQDTTSSSHPAANDVVKITGAVITAVDSSAGSGTTPRYYGFFIQDPAGGPYSGIYVYHSWTASDSNKPAQGDQIDITGIYTEHPATGDGVSELSYVSFTKKGTATVPTPATVTASEVATGGSKAEQYEGVLVKVSSVKVDAYVKDSAGTKNVGFKDNTSGLIVDYDLYDFMTTSPPSTGTVYTSVTGPLHFSFKNFKVLPRAAGDLVK